MHTLLKDPWIAAQIDAALEKIAGGMPSSERAWMREQLAEVLASDQASARVLRAAMPRSVDESGEMSDIVDSLSKRLA